MDEKGDNSVLPDYSSKQEAPKPEDSPLLTPLIDQSKKAPITNLFAGGKPAESSEPLEIAQAIPEKTPASKKRPQVIVPPEPQIKPEPEPSDGVGEFKLDFSSEAAVDNSLLEDFEEEEEGGTGDDSDFGEEQPAAENLNGLFADSLMGGINHFLPFIIHNQTKIKAVQVLALEKQQMIPEGSLGVIEKINKNNYAMLQKEVQKYEAEIKAPLKAVLKSRNAKVSPEVSLATAVAGMGIGIYAVTMQVSSENRLLVQNLIDSMPKKGKEGS